jgi:O-antigen ligase
VSQVTLAGLFEVDLPSGRVVAALLPLIVLVLAFVIYCLVDLIRAQRVQYLPKVVWGLLIVLVSPPFGAIGYLVFGKDRYDRQHTAAHGSEDADADRWTTV